MSHFEWLNNLLGGNAKRKEQDKRFDVYYPPELKCTRQNKSHEVKSLSGDRSLTVECWHIGHSHEVRANSDLGFRVKGMPELMRFVNLLRYGGAEGFGKRGMLEVYIDGDLVHMTTYDSYYPAQSKVAAVYAKGDIDALCDELEQHKAQPCGKERA